MIILKVNKNDEGQTIFNFLKKNFKSTNLSVIYKWVRKQKIKINDKKINDLKIKIVFNDEVKIYDSAEIVKRNVIKDVDFSELKIIYEDENILIVDKNFNLEMHSLFNKNLDDMIRSYLIFHNQYDNTLENSFIISHIHRLDKLTAGLVIYAKNKISLDSLLIAIQDKEKISKKYLAKLVNNTIKTGQINGFINYDTKLKKALFSEQKIPNYKECSQIHKWIDKNKNILEVQLLTGRKHQIRCIVSYFNCPINGDFRYYAKKTNNKAIALIAYKLIFSNFTDHLSYLNGREFNSKNNFQW